MFVLFVGFTLVGCNYRRDKLEMPLDAAPTFSNIQRYIIFPKCISCHNGPGSPKGVDLSSYESIMDGKQVTPFKAGAESPLFDSVAATPPRMPKGGSLSKNEIALIQTWITNGALKSGTPLPPDPPPAPTYAWISQYLFERRCVGCHSGNNKKTTLDLRTYESLINYEGELLKAVDPGSPEISLLWTNLDAGLMPPPKANVSQKVSKEIIDAVGQWIQDGAKKGSE